MIAKKACASGEELRTVQVPIDMIHVGKRRGLNGPKVLELSKSIEDVGLLHPITVLSRPTVNSLYDLVAGRHRLEAFLILNRDTIPAIVLPDSFGDRRAEMCEIDENLQRSGLTALEESQALARRKELWEEMHPETKRGAKGGRKQKVNGETKPTARGINQPVSETKPMIGDWGTLDSLLRGPAHTTAAWNLRAADLIAEYVATRNPGPHLESRCKELISEWNERRKELDPTIGSNSGRNGRSKSFAEDTAEKTGQSKANVARKAKLGRDLPKDLAEKVKTTPVAKNEKELVKLAKLAKQDREQAEVVADMLAKGEVQSVTEAVAEPPTQTTQEQRDEAWTWLLAEVQQITEDWRAKFGPKIATITRWRGVMRAVDFGG